MDLANVVQKCCGLHLFNFSCRESQLNSNRPRKLAHPHGMTRRIRITSFDCFDHHLKKFLSTILELVVKPVDVTDSNNRNDHSN